MKKIIHNLHATWLLALLLSTISVQGMESNILELTTESSRCLASTEVAKSYLWSTASLWGGLFLITTGGPVSGTFLCAYGAIKFFETLKLQEREETLIKAYKPQEAIVTQDNKQLSQASMISHIQALPEEIRVQIAGYLTAQEKNILMQVCKDSHAWLKNDKKALLLANASTITKTDKIDSMLEYILVGDNKMVSFLIRARVNVNGADLKSYPLLKSLEKASKMGGGCGIIYTPLHLALKTGRNDIIQLLLDAGADINCPHPYNYRNSILHLASADGDIATVKSAIKLGADVNQANDHYPYYKRPLHIASEYNHLDIVKALFVAGANIHQRTYRDTPLHIACRHGNIEIAKFLLIISKADINQDGDYGTPLYEAVKFGNIEMVKLLIEHGTDVHWVKSSGDTLLQIAQQEGHADIVALLKPYFS